MRRIIADGKSAGLVQAAGWIAIGLGVVHLVVAPLERGDIWPQVAAEGVWNTFTLDEPVTLGQFVRAEAFWTTFGSWGVPVLVLGCHILWSARRRHRVPGWLGWILIAWGLPLSILVPASPGWAFPIIGGLVVLGDGQRGRSSAGHRPTAVAGEKR